MIVEKSFLNKLKDFGLNSYESKLWTALLSRGVATAGELSDIANVPRSRSYDVLESLEKKGFIIVKLGKPIKYIAVPPEEVVERVKKQIKEDSQVKQDILDELQKSNILTELTTLHTQGIELVETSDLSGSFKGRKSIYNQMESMIKGAESSVIIMTTTEGFLRKADRFKDLFKKTADRGISIKIVAPLNADAQKIAEKLQGVEVSNIDGVTSRFCVVDGKNVTFMLMDDNEVHPSYDTGIWVNTPFFAQTLEKIFEKEWTPIVKLQ